MWVWLVLAVIAASGCTGYTTQTERHYDNNATNETPNITVQAGVTDLCSYTVCETSKVKCPDGFVVACPNSCINTTGECTACVPSCAGHFERSCDGMACKEITYTCPDGYTAKCQQSCYKGVCVSCVPDCTGHYQEETQSQSGDACAGKNCGSSSVTCPDYYNATCSNTCSSGSCVQCTPSCGGHEFGHLVFSEVYYDTTVSNDKDEWIEIYNPLEIDVNLANWTITDNSGTWKFSETAIAKKSYLVIAKNATAVQQSFGCTPHVSGFTRTLNNDGDQLTLKDASGNEQDFVAWEKGADGAYPQWNVTAEEGKSIARITPNNDTDSVSDWVTAAPQPNC